MTHIWAHGKPNIGIDIDTYIDIYGSERDIDKIQCYIDKIDDDLIPCDPILQDALMDKIHNPVDYYVIPYIPPANTMQAAYAAIASIWGIAQVHLDGDIEEVEFDANVIY